MNGWKIFQSSTLLIMKEYGQNLMSFLLSIDKFVINITKKRLYVMWWEADWQLKRLLYVILTNLLKDSSILNSSIVSNDFIFTVFIIFFKNRCLTWFINIYSLKYVNFFNLRKENDNYKQGIWILIQNLSTHIIINMNILVKSFYSPFRVNLAKRNFFKFHYGFSDQKSFQK